MKNIGKKIATCAVWIGCVVIVNACKEQVSSIFVAWFQGLMGAVIATAFIWRNK